MVLFEALYDRPCQSPVYWTEVGEIATLGPDIMLDITKKIKLIRKRLLTSQSQQKGYADRRRRLLSFKMDKLHNVFYMSMLRKYEPYPSYVLSWVDTDMDDDVSYEEGLIQILDIRPKLFSDKTMPLMKVLWRYHGVEEVTWE
ncbi:uncharacterized protein LOC132304896 [Cornus florida]|uniref:uncharacterized protein LOC132304896 n=1 Tax=Cornus florida TaxID=4283 RepID=UPI002899F0E9|nr:uncharacterized protein LOC132304896 [Cornus florida]